MFSLVVAILLLGSTIFFRIAAILRLSLPLLYALIVPTIFHEWHYAHYALANGIWYVSLLLVVLLLSFRNLRHTGIGASPRFSFV